MYGKLVGDGQRDHLLPPLCRYSLTHDPDGQQALTEIPAAVPAPHANILCDTLCCPGQDVLHLTGQEGEVHQYFQPPGQRGPPAAGV